MFLLEEAAWKKLLGRSCLEAFAREGQRSVGFAKAGQRRVGRLCGLEILSAGYGWVFLVLRLIAAWMG
jgi:hypothetical protein